jgi:hypothetical protein
MERPTKGFETQTKLRELSAKVSEIESDPRNRRANKLQAFIEKWGKPLGKIGSSAAVGTGAVIAGNAMVAAGMASPLGLGGIAVLGILIQGAGAFGGLIMTGALIASELQGRRYRLEKAKALEVGPTPKTMALLEEAMKTGAPSLQAAIKIAISLNSEEGYAENLPKHLLEVSSKFDELLKKNIREGDVEDVKTLIEAGANLSDLPWQAVNNPDMGTILVENAPDAELKKASAWEKGAPIVREEKIRRAVKRKPKETQPLEI